MFFRPERTVGTQFLAFKLLHEITSIYAFPFEKGNKFANDNDAEKR